MQNLLKTENTCTNVVFPVSINDSGGCCSSVQAMAAQARCPWLQFPATASFLSHYIENLMCGSSGEKSNNILLCILTTLPRLKRCSAELPSRVGLSIGA